MTCVSFGQKVHLAHFRESLYWCGSMRNTRIINVEFKFQTQNLSSKEEERYAACILLFLSPKWLFLFELMLLNVGVQPHKMLSFPWAVCVRHHGLVQVEK